MRVKENEKNNAHNSFHEQNKIDLFNFERFFRCTPCTKYTHTHDIFTEKKPTQSRERDRNENEDEKHTKIVMCL